MTKLKVCLHPKEYKEKPTGFEVAKISSEIGKCDEKLNCPTSIYEFAYDVGMSGKTFSPATFTDGSRGQENFEQMQLMVLDFDGGVSYKEIQERARRYELPILFSYSTFSSTEDDERFRAVFLNDIPIQDRRAAKITKNLLRTVFPESDKHDADISRMYFGGKTCSISTILFPL
jgi:hypothetical protein